MPSKLSEGTFVVCVKLDDRVGSERLCLRTKRNVFLTLQSS